MKCTIKGGNGDLSPLAADYLRYSIERGHPVSFRPAFINEWPPVEITSVSIVVIEQREPVAGTSKARRFVTEVDVREHRSRSPDSQEFRRGNACDLSANAYGRDNCRMCPWKRVVAASHSNE